MLSVRREMLSVQGATLSVHGATLSAWGERLSLHAGRRSPREAPGSVRGARLEVFEERFFDPEATLEFLRERKNVRRAPSGERR
jgi:hypothetical protein